MGIFYFSLVLQLVLIGYQLVKLRNLKKSILKAQDKYISLIKKNDLRIHEIYLSLEKRLVSRKWPDVLKNLPLADKEGLISSIKKVDIPCVKAPHNASFVQLEDGYLLIFRYDTPFERNCTANFSSHIGSIFLTKDFIALEESFVKIETGSLQAEDPRIFRNNGKDYLLFNEPDPSCLGIRRLRLGGFDVKKRVFTDHGFLKWPKKQVEKNWTPFSYEEKLHFIYTISPQKILKLSDPQKNTVEMIHSSLPSSQAIYWAENWGELRGGTPAELIEGQYLAFFHSSFEDHIGIKWYVMGAYSFDSKPPFRITGISSHPILCENLYQTELLNTAHAGVRSIYPVGFVREKNREKDEIHLSCGENDSSVKIITFDTKRLLAGLKSC